MDIVEAFPYTKGNTLRITSHIAPAPTPVTTNCCLNGQTEREERDRLTPLERCLRNPPLPGETGSQSTNLEILAPLKVGDYHNAQVFVAEMQDTDAANNQRKKVVAKVYDPLYFDDQDGYLNPFRCVNKHYTHEVYTYALLAHLQGTLIPKFYGSFSLEIPVSRLATRVVRLIVIEYIAGVSMQQAHLERYSLQSRQQIIKWVIDFESRVFQLDIALTDLRPRNVMLPDPSDYPQRTIVFLDFGGAIFGRSLVNSMGDFSNPLFGQYISPLLRWTSSMALPFGDWIDWDFRPWIEVEYAHEAASVTEEIKHEYSSYPLH